MAEEEESDYPESVPGPTGQPNNRGSLLGTEDEDGTTTQTLTTAAAASSNHDDEEEEDGHSSDSSTSSNGRDKCPICLFSFTSQEVGKPENCDHKFCAICIEEWSNNVSTCPIDRKEFLKIICLQDYYTPTQTREITVDEKNKYDEIDVGEDGGELTFCRICSRSDREESMLLCDGCNQGYHMECLIPALEQIPEEFWYCDDCFASNEDDDPDDELAVQEEIAELMDEVREFGIPETRLRIRTETVPRILRTRQSERIRDAILARTNRRTFREATREVAPAAEDVFAMPGPSRIHPSVRLTRSYESTPGSSRSASVTRRCTAASSTRRPPARQRRRRVSRKTVVLEYDVDNEDDKFAVRTKKIIKKIKRRRRKKTPARTTRLQCSRRNNDTSLTGSEFSNQFSSTNRLELCNDAAKDGLTLNRSRAGIQKLSITGSRNDLDYYSSDDDDDDGGHALGGGGVAGGLMMALRGRGVGGNLRSLRNRKGALIIPDSALPATTDVLGSIMNEQERWMNISNPRNISKIKIKPDGRLEYEGDNERETLNRSRNVPMRGAAAGMASEVAASALSATGSSSQSGTGGGGGRDGGSSRETVTNNGTGSNGPSSAGGSGAGTGAASTANGGGSGGPYPDMRTAAARKAPPDETLLADTKSENAEKKPPVEDSSDEDCPNFSVYSAETMQLAKDISEPTDENRTENEDPPPEEEEQEEDLVQLDDDDMEETVAGAVDNDLEKSDEAAKGRELELHDDSDWDELTNDNNKPGEEDDKKESKEKSTADASPSCEAKGKKRSSTSSAENQLNTESISEDDEEMIVNDTARRSLTPCLDEREQQPEGEQKETTNADEKDLELISDDEEVAEQQSGTLNKTGESADTSARDADEFKRLKRTPKGRNYRDKDRRSPSPKRARPEKRSRGESPRDSSRNNRGSNRRKDIVRYDVRNVIADRKQRPDKYGRDTTKQAKRSRSKSRSSSLSSLSPDENNHGRRSGSPRNAHRRRGSRSRSRSLRRTRRASRSPVVGPRRGRSPRQRSPPAAAAQNAGTRKRRSLSRFTMSPSLSRSPSPAPARSPRARLGPRRVSPGRRRLSPSPNRMRNGRGGEPPLRKKDASPRRLQTSEAKTNRRRRRSKSASSSSSDSASPVRGGGARGKAAKLPPGDHELIGKSWTPPLRADDRVLGDFKVTVKNSGAATTTTSKKEKKAKRKKGDKKREAAAAVVSGEKEKKRDKKKSKTKQRDAGGVSKSTTSGPSKEIFSSGDNILVSVNFASKRGAENSSSGQLQQQTTIVTLPPSKDQIVTLRQRQERREKAAAQVVEVRAAKGGRGSSGKSKRGVSPSRENLVVTKNKRHRKVDAKPVAIIDLDGSPFRVMTPSPKAVIVLSDSDGEGGGGGERKKKSKKSAAGSGAADDHKKSNQKGESSLSGAVAAAAHTGGSSGIGGAKKKQLEAPIRVNSDDEDVDLEIIENVPKQQQDKGSLLIDDNSGPKTPPLPASMKFSMSMRSKSNVLRQVNPLHDAREEEEDEDKHEDEGKKNSNGVGATGGVSAEQQQQQSNRTSIPSMTTTAAADKDTSSTSAGGDQQQGDATSNTNNNNNIDQSLSTNGGPLTMTNSNSNNKIGPNTPPEPAPTSPDAYDPFEPTKSNSVSPAQDMDLSESEPEKKTTTKQQQQRSQTSSSAVKIVNSPRHKDLRTLDEHKGKIPVKDLVMKLLNSTAGHHHHHHHSMGGGSAEISSLSPPPPPPPYLEKSLERGAAANESSKGIQILSNVVIQQGKNLPEASGGGKSLKHTAAYSTMNSTTTSYSIMKQMQTEAKRMLYAKQKAAPPSVTTSTATTCTPTLTQAMLKKHNAECTMMDIAAESPYSPGSGDFEDLFEPPMDTSGSNRIPSMAGPSPMKGGTQSKNQAELFDNLFGSHSPPTQGTKWTPSKARKPQGRTQISSSNRRAQHNRKHSSLDDDVPDSAVDLVLKENYIQKLNRQERVVEEVKLVLKPHFIRKYITKDDYKEIMKKSVSKICNSRSGEINPQKIKAFIDAYVKKYRYRRKHGTSSGAGGGTAGSGTAATGGGTGGGGGGTGTVATSSSSSINVNAGNVSNQNKSSRWGT